MNQKKKLFKKKMLSWIMVLMLVMTGMACYTKTTVNADVTVYITRTGSKYHAYACGNGTYYKSTLSYARSIGLDECSKCGDDISYSSGSTSGGGGTSTKSKPKPIKINKTSVILVKGKSVKLKIKNATESVVWSSSKSYVATVSSSGKVTAKKKGKTIITAKVGSKTKKCTVKVEEPKLTTTKVTMRVGETKKIKLKGCNHSIKWSSNDSYVVKVKKGKLIAKDTGTARITARVHGKKFVCKIKVQKPEVKSLTLDKTGLNMSLNNTYSVDLTCKVSPSSVLDYYDVICTSKNESIASVYWLWDNEISVSAEGIGETDIIIKVGGKETKCHVVVTE